MLLPDLDIVIDDFFDEHEKPTRIMQVGLTDRQVYDPVGGQNHPLHLFVSLLEVLIAEFSVEPECYESLRFSIGAFVQYVFKNRIG